MSTITKRISLTRTTRVPDTNRDSNFGGIACNGKTVYCCKTNQAETHTTIHKFSSYKDQTSEKKRFAGLGHANGMAFWNGHLYIPAWGQKHNVGGIFKVNFEKGTKKRLTGPAASCLAHLKDEYFIIRTKTSGSIMTFAVIKMGENSYKKVKEFKVKNPQYKNYHTNQDIGFHNGKIFIMQTSSNLRGNAILIAKIGSSVESIVAGKTYVPYKVWLTATSSNKYEAETMDVDSDGNYLFGMNTPTDGIYKKV